LTWTVETTASRAMKRSPSSVSTPAQRPPSMTSPTTRLPQSTVPPWSRMRSTSAPVSRPEPPRGIVQLRRWRPNTIEYARGPEPGESIGTSVW
jgi:hypothetical protein